MFQCWQEWSQEHSYTCKPGSKWSHNTDTHQERCIIRVAVADCKACTAQIKANIAPSWSI